MTKALFALLLLASPAFSEGGWSKRGSSLLLHDSTGELVSEIGLTHSEEAGGGKLVSRETRGGASKSGRFAWTFERTNTWNSSRTVLLQSKRLLKYLGAGGEEIWTSEKADAGDTFDPVVLSDDGETLLLASRGKEGWEVAAKGHLGNMIMDLYPAPELEDLRLTRDGKYAMVRWTIPDKQSTHTFWNLAAKKRKDVPSGDLHLGKAELAEDGKVRTKGKVVVDLAELK